MSIEALLKPRIKVIAPMPLMKNKVGEFLYRQEDDKGNIWFGISAGKEMHFFKLDDFKEWSNIFHICEWHEERKESEMPEYVKYNPEKTIEHVSDRILKVKEWTLFSDGMGCAVENKGGIKSAPYLLPATEEQYIQYNKKENYVNRKT